MIDWLWLILCPIFLVGIFKSVLYPNPILIIYILSFCSISISKSVCLPVFVSLSSSAASIPLLAEDLFKWLPTFQWCVFGQTNYICVLSFDTSLKLPINSVASDFFCLTEQVGHFLCLFFVLGRIFAKINIALLSASVQLAWKTTPPPPPPPNNTVCCRSVKIRRYGGHGESACSSFRRKWKQQPIGQWVQFFILPIPEGSRRHIFGLKSHS